MKKGLYFAHQNRYHQLRMSMNLISLPRLFHTDLFICV